MECDGSEEEVGVSRLAQALYNIAKETSTGVSRGYFYRKQQFIAQLPSLSCILRLIKISGKTSEW